MATYEVYVTSNEREPLLVAPSEGVTNHILVASSTQMEKERAKTLIKFPHSKNVRSF